MKFHDKNQNIINIKEQHDFLFMVDGVPTYPSVLLLAKNQDWESLNAIGLFKIPTVVRPEITKKAAYENKLNQLSATKSMKEKGGIIIAGSMVRTDDQSQSKLLGMRTAAQLNPDRIFDFESEPNVWSIMNTATALYISERVIDYIDEVFKSKKVHFLSLAAIFDDEASTVADIQAYDVSVGWPDDGKPEPVNPFDVTL